MNISIRIVLHAARSGVPYIPLVHVGSVPIMYHVSVSGPVGRRISYVVIPLSHPGVQINILIAEYPSGLLVLTLNAMFLFLRSN